MPRTCRFSNDGIATWRDAAGTRWILAEVSGAIAAFKVVDKGGAPAVERVWTSRNMASPRTPIVVNGVVFALAGGNIGANAVLYALDPATGQGAVEQRDHDHVCSERRLVRRHRAGVCGDGRQHGVRVRHSVGDQLDGSWGRA